MSAGGRQARLPRPAPRSLVGPRAAWVGAALLALGALDPACARAPRISSATPATPCNTTAQCLAGSTCFLGACRGRAGAISSVLVEVRPPNDSRSSLLQTAGVDLGRSLLNDFALAETLAISGSVAQASDTSGAQPVPVAAAAIAFTARGVIIPERVPEVSVQTDTSGSFNTRLPDATWDLTVLPPQLPVDRRNLGLTSANLSLALLLPAVSRLQRVQGALTAAGVPLIGARVVAVDPGGISLGAATTSDAAGDFTLALPPDTTAFKLRIGPPSDTGVAGPIPSFDATPSGANVLAPGAPLHTDVGALPLPATLTGRVVDAAAQPVAGARVYALSLDGKGWVISRTATSGADGVFRLQVREGRYLLEAAPGSATADLGLSSPTEVQVGIGRPLVQLFCPPKVHFLGLVLRPDGLPVGAGTQISASRLPDRLVSGRVAQVLPTDSTGHYQLIGDAGGQYRLDITPPRDLGLPRRAVVIDVGTADGPTLPDVGLPSAVEAVGTVTARSTATPVAGATVEFFALDAGGRHAISLGSAITDEKGRYKAVLPDAEDPAALTP